MTEDDKVDILEENEQNDEHYLDFPNDEFATLEELCQAAVATDRTVRLKENATLHSVIRLRQKQHLRIIGAYNELSSLTMISGSVHSLFLLNNSSRLTLRNINLDHTIDPKDHKDVGAAVNLRYKGQLELNHGRITSVSGFCIWAVQKSSVKVSKCHLEAPARSALVCFGQPKCHLKDCKIIKAGVHAVCARGACDITLLNCRIENSTVRAIYAYAKAKMTLEECVVTGTLRADKAAIEVAASASESEPSGASSSITMKHCRVVDNIGMGVCLRGLVPHVLEDNGIERNGGGNLVLLEEEDDNENMDSDGNTNNASGLRRRDASGSSFRKGDWWCPKCIPKTPVIGRLDQCPTCQSEKGKPLTIQEITLLNQGTATVIENSKDNSSNIVWWFDGGDDKRWVQYDVESCRLLERAFQENNGPSSRQQGAPIVKLRLGRANYQVNVQTMEQTNVESQFLRLVRRRQSPS